MRAISDTREHVTLPSAARIYDYFLGGAHNFPVDRQAAAKVLEVYPDVALGLRANRAFLRRAVNYLALHGVDQFLDVGAGIPTMGSVHEVAWSVNPAARIVSIDNDPVAIHQAELALGAEARVRIVEADARDPEAILFNQEVRQFLDFHRPIGVLLVALLHFLTVDHQAERLVSALRCAVPTGSMIVISHGTLDGIPKALALEGERLYAETANPSKLRTRDEISHFFDGLHLIPPGLVYAPLWHPDSPLDPLSAEPHRSAFLAGVAVKC